MAHIVFITSGIASIYNTNLELARRLQAAGHRVTYAGSDDIRQAVSDRGVDFVHLLSAPAVDDAAGAPSWGKVQRIRDWLSKWGTIRQRRALALDQLAGRRSCESLRALKPDLILVDIELADFVITAVALRVPVALVSTWLSLFKRPGLPPLHLDLVPGQGWRGSQLGLEGAWLKFRAWKWLQRRLAWLRTVGTDPNSILKRYASETEFPFQREADVSHWLIPYVYRTLPLLCLNAYELDFPHTPYPTVRYTGPMIRLESGASASASSAMPDTLNSLLQQRAASPRARPLIYCAFGAFFRGNDVAFIQRVVTAFSDKPEWDVVLALGGRFDISVLGALPNNVHAYTWVPQTRVLQSADAAVVHAGIATLNECIHFGVPMLVYPFKQTTDQMGNAARIAYHNLGIMADREVDQAKDIIGKLEHLLGDPSYKTRLEAMRSHFDKYTHEDRAVNAVEAILTSQGANA